MMANPKPPPIHRVYFWFDGAPADRPGGPWWYEDVIGWDDALYPRAQAFAAAMRPFAKGLVLVTNPVVREHDPMDVYPCDGERTFWYVRPEGY